MGIREPLKMHRAVFLDRDGVLNEIVMQNGLPLPPRDSASLRFLPGVEQALRRLKAAGYLLIVVTNQPDIARGKTSRAVVDEIHGLLAARLPLDGIEMCPHDDDDRCDCRKPKPGLLTRAADRFGINLKESYMVGDRWRDISAGKAAGCRTILVGGGYDERFRDVPDLHYPSLAAAASQIMLETAPAVAAL